VNNRE